MDKTQELIQYLEITSPELLLTDIAGGVPPTNNDLLIVQSIRDTSRLPDPVINVLLQYVLLKTDMKLTKSYAEKIAGHWARKRIKTAAEALDLAKKEHTQYKRWQDTKQRSRTVLADRDTLNDKVADLVRMYNTGENKDYAIGGLETLSDIFGVDLLERYGIPSSRSDS